MKGTNFAGTKKFSFQALLNIQYYFLVATAIAGIASSIVFIAYKSKTQPEPPILAEEPASLSQELPDRTFNEPLIDTVIVMAVKKHNVKGSKDEPVF